MISDNDDLHDNWSWTTCRINNWLQFLSSLYAPVKSIIIIVIMIKNFSVHYFTITHSGLPHDTVSISLVNYIIARYYLWLGREPRESNTERRQTAWRVLDTNRSVSVWWRKCFISFHYLYWARRHSWKKITIT